MLWSRVGEMSTEWGDGVMSTYDPKMQHVTLRVPREVWVKVRLESLKAGVSAQRWVEETLVSRLRWEEKKSDGGG